MTDRPRTFRRTADQPESEPTRPRRGAAVYNRAHDRIGRIHKVEPDPQTGDARQVTLTFGGLFGLGARRQTVAATKLTYAPRLGGFVVPLSVDLLRLAPDLDLSRLAGWDRLPGRDEAVA